MIRKFRGALLAGFLTSLNLVVPAARAQVEVAYSNLAGAQQPAYTVSARYNSEGGPYRDVVVNSVVLEDVMVDSRYWGRFVVAWSINFYKGGSTKPDPQVKMFVYDTSGPNGGPGRRLDSTGLGTTPATGMGEGTLSVLMGKPLFQIPADGKLWIGYQFSSFASAVGAVPEHSVEEMASIGSLRYGPSEIGSTVDGIWVGDEGSMGAFGPAQFNPTGSFVAQANLNLGMKLDVVITPDPPALRLVHANPRGARLGSAHSIGFDQFLGTRFTLDAPLEISGIDLDVTRSYVQDWFVAIVALNSRTDFPIPSPASGLANLEQVRISKLFSPGPVSTLTTVRVPISGILGPGAYAIVVGTGLFGSPASTYNDGALQNYAAVQGSDTIAWVKPATQWQGAQYDFIAQGTPTYGISIYGEPFRDVPAIDTRPQGQLVAAGQSATFYAHAAARFSPVTYQWRFNGRDIAGATSPTLTIPAIQPSNAGAYDLVASTAWGSVTSPPAVLGVTPSAIPTGSAFEFAGNVQHANGNVYDQVLLTGSSATVRADPGQVTRVSFIDLNDDIVQVEFSGAGAMSIALASASAAALPVKYNQEVSYVKGHASISISGADETTNVSIFSVGRITAVNQSLFRPEVYDGFADIELLTIQSSNGKFGGVRAANASFFSHTGTTGIVAPGVHFMGPVYFSDITAFDTAVSAILLGDSSEVRATGGDLLQSNGRAIRVSGVKQLRFADGSDSHGVLYPTKANNARLEQEGLDVTTQIVVNPTP